METINYLYLLIARATAAFIIAAFIIGSIINLLKFIQ